MSLQSRTRKYEHFEVSFPDDRIIQVTLIRTSKLNCIDKKTSQQIQEIWDELDRDESLWVGIITGSGRAFCTGADLEGELYAVRWTSDANNGLKRMEQHERGRRRE